MKLKGAQILVETLIEQGVRDVFGYPGGQVINIYDALYEYKDKIVFHVYNVRFIVHECWIFLGSIYSPWEFQLYEYLYCI